MALEAQDRDGLVEAALLMLGTLQDANLALFDGQDDRHDSHDPGRFVNFDADVWLAYMQELLPEPETLLAAYGAGYLETAEGDSIGYAYVSDLGDAYSMEDFYAATNDVRYCRGLILDLRMYGGSGTEPNARSAVGRFVAQGAPAYLRSLREGPGRYDMTEPVTVNATKNGAWQFTGPTVVLTGRGTSGAAELLVLLLASQDHVTLVGDTTAGFANPGPRFDLTEGWSLEIPSMMTYDLSMGAVFDRGIPPDIPVPAAPADFEAGIDPVLDAALAMLAGKPGVPPRIR